VTEIEPTIQVVRGNPTEEELAAVLAALTSVSKAARPVPSKRSDHGWAAYWRTVRTPLRPGPGVWRASGRPE
jgi:acyl-CoA carboxylase epsilon subunit